MAESRVNRNNYVMIQGFMIRDLKLKGNELLIYAIIYGFSQAENQTFSGSLQYLSDWTNSTRQGVIKSLKSLIEKGYIKKKESIINNVKFCEYYTTEFTRGSKQSLTGVVNSVYRGSKLSLHNNININTIDNKDIYMAVIDYLNKKAGLSYRAKSKDTQKHINARIAEGYTVEDFKSVIDKKCTEWIGTEYEKYLRPCTLFGTKFESYLNSKSNTNKPGKLTPEQQLEQNKKYGGTYL